MRTIDKWLAYKGTLMVLMIQTTGSLCRLIGLQRLHDALLINIVKRTALFDRDFYLNTNDDVVQSAQPALRHYIEYGDREGRAPMPLFDPDYYRRQAGIRRNVNALIHYAWVGRYRRLATSPWFDTAYYLAQNKDIARSGIDPLHHFMQWGAREGRSPSAGFDCSYYLRMNSDVANSTLNPLVHYLLRGRHEGRSAKPGEAYLELSGDACSLTVPDAIPEPQAWLDLDGHSGAQQHIAVDVIVPVYKGRAETLRCLYSVLSASNRTDYELIVINDASPDNVLSQELRELAQQGLFALLENELNLGFVGTVNRGMALHPERDIVLLNADTEVYNDWLDRLLAAAASDEHIGTITPLSNNATICSYPHTLQDNSYPLEVDYAELDRMAAAINGKELVETPTGVGFCMYIRRECLAEAGLFDQKTFGKGYGEENDFCQRAKKLGWKSMITANVFVHHWGSASFQGEKGKRIQGALSKLAKRHPQYQKDVDAFIRKDPLLRARQRLDLERLKRCRRSKNVLIIVHARGGGTERHIQEDIKRLTRAGYGIYVMRPVRGRPSLVSLSTPHNTAFPNLPQYLLQEVHILAGQLTQLGVTEIHTHGLVDFDPESAVHVANLVQQMGVRWEANIHDYKVICPRINLADAEGRYCQEPDDEACDNCLSEHGSDFSVSSIAVWRDIHARALALADVVQVPDEDVRQRLLRYFPQINLEVTPHEDLRIVPLQQAVPQSGEGKVLKVVVIGAISKLKGYNVLLACARDARARKLPIQFIVMGYSMNDARLRDAGVTVTGKYDDENAVAILEGLQPDLIWLPSLWPETYSYTLSIAMQIDCPIAAFDIGAIASRLRQCGRDQLLVPLEVSNFPEKITDFFVKKCQEGLPET